MNKEALVCALLSNSNIKDITPEFGSLRDLADYMDEAEPETVNEAAHLAQSYFAKWINDTVDRIIEEDNDRLDTRTAAMKS